MRREFYPEVQTEVSHTPRGRQLVKYTVDTLIRHADQIDNSLRYSLGVSSFETGLSIVRLGLYVPLPSSTGQEAAINIVGTGRSFTMVVVEGVQSPHRASQDEVRDFYWQAYSNENRARMADESFRLKRLVQRPRALVGAPTNELAVFMLDDVARVGALREYYVILSQNSEQIKATVETQDNAHQEDETIRLTYIPNQKDGRPRPLLYIKRVERNGLHHWEFR